MSAREPVRLLEDVKHYQWLCLASDVDEAESLYADRIRDFKQQFRGRPVPRPWTYPLLERCPDEERLPLGDMPNCQPGVYLFSERAAEALRSLLEPHGELLPMDWAEGRLVAFNVLTVLDAIDPERSHIDYYKDHKWSKVNRAAWRYNVIGDAAVFKVPQLYDAFVMPRFVAAVAEHQLLGMRFLRLGEATW